MSHLLPGRVGWSSHLLIPDEDNGFAREHRYLPSFLRLIAKYGLDGMPAPPNEREVVEALTTLWRDEAVRCNRRLEHTPDDRQFSQELLDFINFSTYLDWYWRREGRRVPVMRSHLEVEQELNCGHISRFELAHLRIPEHLAYDEDVLWMQAFFQGMDHRDLTKLLKMWGGTDIGGAASRTRGLYKLLSSPWVQFAMTAPFMHQYGQAFGDALYTENVARMQFLLVNPYRATEGELEAIQSTPFYRDARVVMLKTRSTKDSRDAGKTLHLPPGGWYMGGRGWSGSKPLSEWLIFGPLRGYNPKYLRANRYAARTFRVD